MRTLHASSLALLISSVACAPESEADVSSSTRSLSDSTQVGWLAANQPSLDDYTPDANLQWNSSGALNSVHRVGVGSYVVSMPGLGAYEGNVQVQAYGSSSSHCKLKERWSAQGDTLSVPVLCFAGATPSDEPFVAAFEHVTADSTKVSYAVAPADGSRTLLPDGYEFAPLSAHGITAFYSAGDYFIEPFCGSGDCDGALVQLTAVGAAPGYAYGELGVFQELAPAKLGMSVSLLGTGSSEPAAGRLSAYAHKTDETEHAQYGVETTIRKQWSTTGASMRVLHVAAGEYVVTIPGFASLPGALPLITGDRVGGAYFGSLCKADSWWSDGGSAKVRVRCWSGSTPTDAAFFISYLSRATPADQVCDDVCDYQRDQCQAWGDPQCWCDYNYKACMKDNCGMDVSGPKTCPKPKGPKQPPSEP